MYSSHTKGQALQRLQQLWGQITTIISRATENTSAAIVIWLVGAWATRSFLEQLGVGGPIATYSFVLQGLLTVCQGPVWNPKLRVGRGGAFIIGIGALIFDVILNIGGFWIYLQNLGNTTFWQAVMAATEQTAPPSGLTCFLIAVALGMCTAAGPEALWDQ